MGRASVVWVGLGAGAKISHPEGAREQAAATPPLPCHLAQAPSAPGGTRTPAAQGPPTTGPALHTAGCPSPKTYFSRRLCSSFLMSASSISESLSLLM